MRVEFRLYGKDLFTSSERGKITKIPFFGCFYETLCEIDSTGYISTKTHFQSEFSFVFACCELSLFVCRNKVQAHISSRINGSFTLDERESDKADRKFSFRFRSEWKPLKGSCTFTDYECVLKAMASEMSQTKEISNG